MFCEFECILSEFSVFGFQRNIEMDEESQFTNITDANECEVRSSGSVTPAGKGKARKKVRNPVQWKKNIVKKELYSSKRLPSRPTCNHLGRKDFHCSEATMQDVRKFHAIFYPKSVDYRSVKIDQDNLILKYTTSESPKCLC